MLSSSRAHPSETGSVPPDAPPRALPSAHRRHPALLIHTHTGPPLAHSRLMAAAATPAKSAEPSTARVAVAALMGVELLGGSASPSP